MSFFLGALVLSALACLVVGSRRHPARAPLATELAIGALLVFPLLSLLPKWQVIPLPRAARTEGPDAAMGVVELAAAALAGWLPLLAALWLAGAAFMLLRLLAEHCRIRRIVASATPAADPVLAADPAIRLRVSAAVTSPFACGILRRCIVVPADWQHWSPLERSAVLRHELSHHRRRDPLRRLLAAVACAIHWHNPFVWWLARRHAIQAEIACDAAVVAGGVPADAYAHLLCDFAGPGRLAAPGVADSTSLGARVRQLMAPESSFSRRSGLLAGALVVTAAVAIATLDRARPATPVPRAEVERRLSADPFPGNP